MTAPNKNLFLWALYDFANSIVLMAFLFYFSQWLVIDQGKPAWWYNVALIVASALFIITAPFVSRRIDATKKKINGLRVTTVIAIFGHIVISILAMLTDGLELLIVSLYTIFTAIYLVSFLYFTPMLNDLSDEKDRSWKSGIGQGANSIGQVTGVLITLPFVNGVTLFGEPGRVQALLPATIIFGLLTLPMLLFYKEKLSAETTETLETVKTSGKEKSVSLVALFKEVFSHKALALVFLAYFLFSDSLLTFANNFPLYLEVIHGVSDTIKSILTAGILILAATGAVVFGKIADKKGNLKTLKFVLIIWCFIFVAMATVTNFSILVPIFLLAGLLFGPIWSVSRALVGELSPPHLLASSYSYYVVAERFATFIGPALWSLALITMGEGWRGYQTGMILMGALMIVSVFVLNKVGKVEVRQKT